MTPNQSIQSLETKAMNVEAFLRQHFLDENSVVYSLLDTENLRPPEESFFLDDLPNMSIMDYHIEGHKRSEVAAYENCGMTTGAYLHSTLCQHETTRSPESLENARREFEALRYIYEIGKEFEEGFFPKIYGNKLSLQTSSDQVLYAITALDHFHAHAPPNAQRAIEDMIPKMVLFWTRRDYQYTYYHVKDMRWPMTRFPTFLSLARKYSDDAFFKDEYERLLAKGYGVKPEWAQLTMKRNGEKEITDYEKKNNAYLIANMADCFTMDVMNFDVLIENDPDNPLVEAWRDGIKTMWREAKITIAPNGKCYGQVLVDMDTGAVRRTGGHQNGDDHPGAESGWSAMIARAAVTAAKHFPDDEEMIESVVHILSNIDVEDMTYHDEPERWNPRYRFKTRFLSGDSITNWLWAYWQTRRQAS